MKKTKLSFKTMKEVLSRSELKSIVGGFTGGSDGCFFYSLGFCSGSGGGADERRIVGENVLLEGYKWAL